MSTRQEVYEAIDTEREYQNKWKDPNLTDSNGEHTSTEFLVYIRDYVEEALHFMTREPDPVCMPKAQHSLRKIAALAVAAMEQHGAPKRV